MINPKEVPMNFMVCLDGAMLQDPEDEFADEHLAVSRALELKTLYPESVVSIVLVVEERGR